MQRRLPVLILSTQVLLGTLINPNHPDILYPDVPSLSTLRNFPSPLLRGHLQVLSPSSSLEQKNSHSLTSPSHSPPPTPCLTVQGHSCPNLLQARTTVCWERPLLRKHCGVSGSDWNVSS